MNGSTKWSSRRALSLSVFLLLALLAAFILFFDRVWPPPVGLGGERPEAAGPTPGARAAAEAPCATTTPEEARRPVEESEAYEIHVPYPPGWALEVVRRVGGKAGGESLEPVPGAWVRAIPLDGAGGLFSQELHFHAFPRHFTDAFHWFDLTGTALVVPRSPLSLAEPPAGLGRSFQADGEGRVRLPRTMAPRDFIFVGRTAVERGCLMPGLSDHAPGPHRLELRPDSVLRIQVVDGQGVPKAGVPIRVVVCSSPICFTPGLETREPDGIVELHCIQGLFEARRRSGEEDPRLHVHLALPLRAPVYAAVEPDFPPGEPIRLVLPPTGSVRIEFPPRGLEEGEWVRAELLGPDMPEEQAEGLPSPLPADSFFARKRSSVGSVVFPYVGLGLELTAWVERYAPIEFWHGFPASKEFEGPAFPGQEVLLRIEDLPGLPLLTGRAVDERGEPVAGRRLVVSLDGDRAFSSRPNCTTDAAGRFQRPVRPFIDRDPCPSPRWLRVSDPFGGPDPFLEGTLELPEVIGFSGHDVGELRLLPVPLVAAGIVLDEEGRALPDAHVMAIEPISYEQQTSGPCPAWTDAEGRFRLYSSKLRAGIEIFVWAEGFIRVRRTAVAGARELRFVLRRGAGLEGSVLLPEGAPPEQFCLVLRAQGAPEDKGLEFTVDRQGRIRLADLIPGSRNLRIHSGHAQGPLLHSVEGIRLEAGAVGRDPRLQGIDLGPLVQPVELEVVDASGQRARGVTATVTGKEGTFRATRGSHYGSLSFFLPRGEHEIRVEAPRFRSAVIRVPPGKQRVVLEPLP